MKITNVKDLVNNRPLEIRDVVVFEVNGETFDYHVNSSYLRCNSRHNDAIFKALNLNKMAFVRPLYAADAPRSGSTTTGWPTVQMNDMDSLTRVVGALYLAIEAVKPTIELIIGGKKVELSPESSQAIFEAAKSA